MLGGNSKIDIEIKAQNRASKELRKLQRDLHGTGKKVSKVNKQGVGFGKQFSGALRSIGKAARVAGVGLTAGLGLAITGIGVKSVQMASDFSKGMGNVATLIDTDVESMEDMKKEMMELSKVMPVALSDMTRALYDVRSAGFGAEEAIGMVKESGILATAGLSTTAEATDILTSAMNSFKSEGLSAHETANILFKTVKAGKTTVKDLAISFGASAPVIAEAGIKLVDFQAATAALTTTGLPASQAQMGLRQAIVALIKPTGEMEKLFEALGVESGRELIDTSDDMSDIFGKLKGAADENNISFEKAIGSVEALNATTGILGETGEAYKGTMEDMKEPSDELTEAFNKQNEEADAQYQILKNNLNVEMIKLGNVILPELIEIMQAIPFLPEVWKEWSDNIKKVGEAVEWLNPPLKLAEELGTFLGENWDKLSEKAEKLVGWFKKLPTGKDTIDITEKKHGGYVRGRKVGGNPMMDEATLVGEAGPEIVKLPVGSKVIPNHRIGGGSNNFYFNFSGATIADKYELVRMIEDEINRKSELREMGSTA